MNCMGVYTRALAHYSADKVGHTLAINRAVPEMYRKLMTKYEAIVTYQEDPKAHILVEFSLDALLMWCISQARANIMPFVHPMFSMA